MTILRGSAVWIKVTETFRYRPNQGSCIVYRPGTYNVPTAAATLAVAAGKAVRMTKARKDEEPVEWRSEREQATSTIE
jgi:hypothetical protein